MSDRVETQPDATRAGAAPGLDAAAAMALLQHSVCAIALCDPQGHIDWCNRVLLDLCGGAPAQGRGQSLALLLALSQADTVLLDQALREGRNGQLPDMRIGGHSGSWWRARLSMLPDGRRALHWQAVDELHRQAAEAKRLAELLDVAQDFGRLGVWERDPQSLQGRWDRHMLRVWGLPEDEDTPDFERAAQSIVAEDRAALSQAFRHSIRQAGSYSHRYRVLAADGVVRQVHSQWVVKNGDSGLPERVLGIVVDDTEAWALARTHAETTEQLSLALELAHIVVFRHDLRTDRVSFSDKAFDLLGMPPGGRRAEPAGGARDGAPRRPARALRQAHGAGAGQRPAGGRGDALPARRRQLAPHAHAPHAAARRAGPAGGRARRRAGPERTCREQQTPDRADAPVRTDGRGRRHRLLVRRGRYKAAALERADLPAARAGARRRSR